MSYTKPYYLYLLLVKWSEKRKGNEDYSVNYICPSRNCTCYGALYSIQNPFFRFRLHRHTFFQLELINVFENTVSNWDIGIPSIHETV